MKVEDYVRFSLLHNSVLCCACSVGNKTVYHMTKCAIHDVYELHQNSQIPAGFCKPMSEVRYLLCIVNQRLK